MDQNDRQTIDLTGTGRFLLEIRPICDIVHLFIYVHDSEGKVIRVEGCKVTNKDGEATLSDWRDVTG
jgi:hypothetical protein